MNKQEAPRANTIQNVIDGTTSKTSKFQNVLEALRKNIGNLTKQYCSKLFYFSDIKLNKKMSTSMYVAIVVLLEPPGSFKLLIASIIRLSNL